MCTLIINPVFDLTLRNTNKLANENRFVLMGSFRDFVDMLYSNGGVSIFTMHNYWILEKILGLVSLFNGISTIVGLFNAKAILREE